jgi:hypothetical protein
LIRIVWNPDSVSALTHAVRVKLPVRSSDGESLTTISPELPLKLTPFPNLPAVHVTSGDSVPSLLLPDTSAVV